MEKEQCTMRKDLQQMIARNKHQFGYICMADVFIDSILTRYVQHEVKATVDYMIYDNAFNGAFHCFKFIVNRQEAEDAPTFDFWGTHNYLVMPEEVYKEIRYEDWFSKKLKKGKLGVVAQTDAGDPWTVVKPKVQKRSDYVKRSLLEAMLKTSLKEKGEGSNGCFGQRKI